MFQQYTAMNYTANDVSEASPHVPVRLIYDFPAEGATDAVNEGFRLQQEPRSGTITYHPSHAKNHQNLEINTTASNVPAVNRKIAQSTSVVSNDVFRSSSTSIDLIDLTSPGQRPVPAVRTTRTSHNETGSADNNGIPIDNVNSIDHHTNETTNVASPAFNLDPSYTCFACERSFEIQVTTAGYDQLRKQCLRDHGSDLEVGAGLVWITFVLLFAFIHTHKNMFMGPMELMRL